MLMFIEVVRLCFLVVFFFFKQKTAYEMRISDWSSDVCSSDLSATGLLQTLPSLAVFVFMIPLFGIGAKPAIAALFLYSLLPIVRNTHAGIIGIAPELRETAAAPRLQGPSQALPRLPLARNPP